MKKTALQPLVGVAVAALALTACTPPPSTAALAGGESISESDVTELMEACTKVGIQFDEAQVPRGDVVVSMSIAELMRQGAMDEFAVPEDQLREALAQTVPPELLSDPTCGPLVVQTERANQSLMMLAQSAGAEAANEQYTQLQDDITLNPRYGRMVERDGVLTRVSGSLSAAPDSQ